ncbi:Pore membrane protein of 33 kDa [Cyberlindnera fabianii]|uniref:Pore membrane protein of 33 kDa n=1 Tax=Cyberlindnera fabianii TaxID=36022 RepID=A0A1V2L6D4_CYBFA|nr:Pore membrane protein of 33 kDa [Cyberlindnera fabianii]
MANTSDPIVEEPISNGKSNVASSSSTGAKSSTAPVHKSAIAKLTDLINVSHVRFAWFVSNVITVWHGFLYLQPLFGGARLNSIWYRISLLGAFATFALVIYQNLKTYKTASGKWSVRAFLQDDNVHYLYDSLIWLIFPKHLLALIPFIVFSLFHVLTFIGNEVLPTLGVASGLAKKITSFTVQNHELSRRVAASSELLLLVVLIFKSILFYKWSWISLIAYSIFIKVKSEGSIFTRHVLKDWEVRIDGLVSNQSVPPVVKTYWGSFKRALKSADKFSIIKKVEVEAQKKQ